MVARLVSICGMVALGAAALSSMPGCEAAERARGADSLFALFAPTDPSTAARWALDPYDADRRFEGTLLLANSPFGGEDLYIRLYEEAVNDTNPNVRAAGVRGLANHGRPSHVPLLVERLQDESRGVRLEAARGLQRLHNPVAVPALMRAGVASNTTEPDPEPDVRAEAVHALGQYAEEDVLFALVNALADANLAVNHNAAASLRTLTGQDFGYNRRAWTRWLTNTPTAERFAGRQRYIFPVFHREPRLIELLPLVPPPPNEAASTPVGFPPITSDAFTNPPAQPSRPAGDR